MSHAAALLVEAPPLHTTASTIDCLDLIFCDADAVTYEKEALVRPFLARLSDARCLGLRGRSGGAWASRGGSGPSLRPDAPPGPSKAAHSHIRPRGAL